MIFRLLTATTVFAIAGALVALGSSASEIKGQTKSKIESAARSQNDNGENFFSDPERAENKLPRYRTDTKPGEKIRLYIQAGTPEIDQVKLIGSLKGKTREEIVKAY